MAGPAAEPQLDPLLPLQSWGLRGCSCGKNSLVNNRVQTGNGTSSKGDSEMRIRATRGMDWGALAPWIWKEGCPGPALTPGAQLQLWREAPDCSAL